MFGRRWRRQWQPTPVLLPGKSYGQRSLVGCSHGVAKSRTQLSNFTFTFHFPALEKEMATHSSVLAWRIPGMGEPGGLLVQSQTQLKRLSSSSNIHLNVAGRGRGNKNPISWTQFKIKALASCGFFMLPDSHICAFILL